MTLEPLDQTVLVDGVQLTSAIDRAREAILLTTMIPHGSKHAWVYGQALGDVPRELLKRSDLEQLHVCIWNESLFESLAQWDDRAWTRDPRVHIHRPGEVMQLFGPLVVSPVELRHADPAAMQLRDRVMAFVNKPFNDFIQDQLGIYKSLNEKQNAQWLTAEHSVHRLFFTDLRPACVIAGGPSTGRFYDRVRRHKGNGKIIAASTALRSLLAAEIVPDAVVVLDSLPGTLKHIPENLVGLEKTDLVFIKSAQPEIVKHWPGGRYHCHDRTFYPGGSVLHAEVGLAVAMGSKHLHLFGADLCFPGNRSHIDGASQLDMTGRNLFRTMDGHGNEVFTEEALSQYRSALEDQIELCKGVTFTKWGREGVAVRGCQWGDA